MYIPICPSCKHYRQSGEKTTCAAFPDGIPDDVFVGKIYHKHPIEGDRGVQFEMIAEDTKRDDESKSA
jgi:hypothetical protein